MVNFVNPVFSPNWCWRGSPAERPCRMANRIRQLRQERDLTLDELATAIGTSFQQLQRLEAGTRRLSEKWMRPLAAALGVEPAALFADEAPNINKVVKQSKKIRLSVEEVLVITWWRSLDLAEKRMIASFARDKGLELLANNPEVRAV